jgi:hypothetical protein
MSGHELSVWMDDTGDIWDATLIENITRVERPKSSRMTFITRLQLIFDSKSKESKKYHVFEVRREISTVSGEQCDSVEKQEGAQMTLNHARCFFEYRFRSHSGLPWENRHGIPKDDRSAFVELQYEEPLILVGENRAFADSVETALRLIFQRGDLDRFVKSMSGYGRRMDLAGQFNGHTLQAAIAILRKIVGLHEHFAEKACGPQINHLCDLYTVLMMVGAENLTYTQGNLAPIMGELNTLDLAIKLHTASRILKTNRKLNTPMTMRQISHALGLAKLTPGERISCSFTFFSHNPTRTPTLTFSSGCKFRGI